MLIKAIQKIFLKLRTIIIGIKLRSSVVSLVIFNYNFNSCFSDKLGNLTVALGVAGAGIAFALQVIASLQVG
jgi:hypothetical protein